MKPLAYLAFFFPPTGGAGVQRTVKFVRYLPDHGWSPTVVTVRKSHYWMRDESLGEEIPDSVRVVRTGALTGPTLLGWLAAGRAVGETNARRSGRLQRLLRAISGWVAIPDPYVGWVPFAARAAAKILRSGGVLFTTSSPDSAHLVGLLLAGKGIPWIADFRDPWVRRMSFRPPTGWHRHLQERLEREVVRTASRIVVTSEATRADFLRRYRFLDPSRVVWIPNGWDEDDFPVQEPPAAERFLLLHLGQLNPERPVGPLLDHLEAFFALCPEARVSTRVELVGPRYREDEEEVVHRGLGATVRFEETLSHRKAIGRLLSARVLILMEQESDRGALILPGKIWEYLRARRPILGILPRGDAWDLVSRLQAGACALPSDPAGGAAILAGCFEAFRSGGRAPFLPDPHDLLPFERKALAGRLASLLDEVAAEGGRPPSHDPPRQ